MLVDAVLVTEQFLDVLIVVDAASLKFSAKRRVYARRHLMLNFMTHSDEKAEVIARVAVDRTISNHRGNAPIPRTYRHPSRW